MSQPFWDRERVADEFQRIALTRKTMFGITRSQAIALADEAIAMTTDEAALARGLSHAEAGEEAWPADPERPPIAWDLVAGRET